MAYYIIFKIKLNGIWIMCINRVRIFLPNIFKFIINIVKMQMHRTYSFLRYSLVYCTLQH